jgi:NADH-quinone oxidoreductase subunit C
MADDTIPPGGPPAGPPAAKEPAARPAARPAAPKSEARAVPPSGPPDPAPPADRPVPPWLASLRAGRGDGFQISYWVGDWTVILPADQLLEVARALRDAPDAAFDFCSDVTAVDWPPRAQRFDVVYCLYSTRHRHRARLKVRAAEQDPVPSVSGIWPAANWLEREVWDLFGVNIVGHPDRRRILMPDEWQGHPQRKDYPLEGPGEFLMESPQDWLALRAAEDSADIE